MNISDMRERVEQELSGGPDEWEVVPGRVWPVSMAESILMLDPDTTVFMSMLNRMNGILPTHTRKLSFDPKLTRGDTIWTRTGRLVGRVQRVTDNCNRDDWLSVPTEWTVYYDIPWHQSEVTLAGGSQAKIEWLEDELFPRTGTLTKDSGPFRAGDLVTVIKPGTVAQPLFPFLHRLFRRG